MADEFCIMPPNPYYKTERYPGLERHEVFFGHSYRNKSIKYGLVVFLTPDQHRGDNGVHHNKEFNVYLKRIAQQTAMEYYGWTIEEFIGKFGKNYI